MKRPVAAVLIGAECGRVLVMSELAMRREVHHRLDHLQRCREDRESEQEGEDAGAQDSER